MSDPSRRRLQALGAALLFALAALTGGSRLAAAQGATVYQNGTAIANHLAKWVTQGRIADVGGILGDENGLGVSPFSITDNGGDGLCSNTASTLGGHRSFCLGHDADGNAVLKVTGGDLKLEINGAPVTIQGPTTSNLCANIILYGASNDGLTDTGPALTAALAAQGDDACVFFPAGQFKFTAPFAYTYPNHPYASVTITGAGPDVTSLIGPTNGSLLSFTLKGGFNSIHVRDLSILTPSPCAGCTGLALVNAAPVLTSPGLSAQSDITNVSLYGTDRTAGAPSGVNYWATAIDDDAVSYVNFTNVYIQGLRGASSGPPSPSVGIYLHGDANHPPVVFNFTGVAINLYNRALEFGDFVQGVTWVNGNMIGNTYGIVVSSLPGHGGGQLSYTNSSASNCYSIYAAPGYSYSFMQISNNLFLGGLSTWPWCTAPATNIELGDNSFYATVIGNVFSGTVAETGIHTATANAVGGIIANNMFNQFATGIKVDGTASGVTLSGNNITNAVTGISLGASITNNTVLNNTFSGNTNNLANAAPLYANRIDMPQDCSAVAVLQFGGAATGMTYGSKYCQYSVRGAQATLSFDYTLSAKGTSTGAASIVMPGAAAAGTAYVGTLLTNWTQNMAGLVGQVTGKMQAGQNGASLAMDSATGTVAINDTNFTNTSRIAGQAVYPIPVP